MGRNCSIFQPNLARLNYELLFITLKSEKKPCKKIGQLGFSKQQRKRKEDLIMHSLSPLDFALVRLSGMDIALAYSCLHLSNPNHLKASSPDRTSSVRARQLTEMRFRGETIDLTMVQFAKNNIESRAMNQLSEKFGIHIFYFQLANARIGMKADFALKVVRKKQRIFHNKQILRPLEYTQKKLIFPHFSKNTQSAASFYVALTALIQTLPLEIAQNQCMTSCIRLENKYLRLNKLCKNFLCPQTNVQMLIKSSLPFGKAESVISSIQKPSGKRDTRVIISVKCWIIFGVVLVQAKILSFLLTQLLSSQIIA